MRITIGRGRNRVTTEIASGSHLDKTVREQLTWELKKILFNHGIIKNLS